MGHRAETDRRPYARGIAACTHLALSIFTALIVSIAASMIPATAATETPVFPVGGYFVYASTSDAVNSQKLRDIKASGGDTVITFGSRLRPASLAELPVDCKVGGLNCVESATTGLAVNRIFTYSDASAWVGSSADKCARDINISNNSKLFTVLVLPVQGAGCVSSDNRYDVVVVIGGSSPALSATGSMARAATALGMKFFAGLPVPVNRSDLPYLPDMSYVGTLSQFTGRYLRYQAAANDVQGLAGFYLSTEMPLTNGATFDPILALYRIQNQAIKTTMPSRSAVVSPYLDARYAGAALTLAQTQLGVRNIALTASGVQLNIAIQDGMGTGKGGAFFGNEANSPVDQYAAAIVGAGNWGKKYVAPVREYFGAAAAGVAGTGAKLWANVEGMAPATGANKCDSNLRGQTTKARLDRQLQQLGNAPVKVVSFMWDGYYTCLGTGVSMAQRIHAGKATPIITDSTFVPSTGSLFVTGYNLSGARVQLKWTTASGKVQDKTVTAKAFNPAYGQQRGLNPGLQAVSLNVGPTSQGAGKYYMINVTNTWAVKNDAFYSKRG